MIFDIFIVILLVLLNGFFVAAEFAIVKVRESQVELKVQVGSQAAKNTQHILRNLNAYLSAAQLGITLASLALGWIGEKVASNIVLWFLDLIHFEEIVRMVNITNEGLSHAVALPLSFFFITALHIIFGEQVPKTMAINLPEKTSYAVAVPLRIFYNIFRPLIYLLNASSTFIVRLMGFQSVENQEDHSAEELKMLLEKGKEQGVIEQEEHELIENVFHFNETTVKQIMIPRTKMVALEASATDEKIMEIIYAEGFSRLPVYKNTIDDIVGIVSTKDVLKMVGRGETIVLSNYLRPAYFIPETKKINDLMKDFQKKQLQMAVVIDEFGGTSGIVTMEDVIEELVGDIRDEDDEEEKPTIEKLGEGEYLVSGVAAINDVNELLRYPLPDGDDFETIGGLLNFIFGKIPELNEEMESGGYHFTIVKTSNKIVEQVKIRETLKEDD